VRRWPRLAAARARLAVWVRRAALVLLPPLVLGAAGYFHQPAWDALRRHPYFAIERVEVYGAGPLLSDDEVRDWLRIGAGTSLWDIDASAVEARLRAHPVLANATARRTFPHAFSVAVRERRPRAMLMLDDVFYVDRRGESFGPLGADDERDLPVITGVSDSDPPGYRKWALRRALHLLRRCEQQGCPLPVSEIHLDPSKGIVLYPRRPAVPLVLGWRGWDARMARAARVLSAWEGATERLARVDARFRDQVVVTLQPVPGLAGAAKKDRVSI